MARQQLMTVQQLRELLAGLPAWQGTRLFRPDVYPSMTGKTKIKNPDRGFGAVVVGAPHEAFYRNQCGLTCQLVKHKGVPLGGARPRRCYCADLDSIRRGLAVRRPICHALLIAVRRLRPGSNSHRESSPPVVSAQLPCSRQVKHARYFDHARRPTQPLVIGQ